jgi:hypothetical protein
MNPAGPSPSGLCLSIEVDRASWIAMVLLVLGWLLAVLLVLGWLLAYR